MESENRSPGTQEDSAGAAVALAVEGCVGFSHVGL